MKKIRPAIIPMAIILLGIFLRIYQFEKRAVFDFDQEIAAWWIKNLLIDHKFSLIGQEISVGGVFVGPFYFYLLAPFFLLTNLYPLGGYFLTTLTSFLTMVVLYQLAKTLFNHPTALISIFLYAIHPGTIGLDLTLAPSNMIMLLSSVTALILTKVKRSTDDLLLLGAILGLSFSIHPTVVLLIPICLIYFFVTKQQYNSRKLIFILIPFLIFVSPLILFDLRHNGLMVNNTFQVLFSKSGSLWSGLALRVVSITELILVVWAATLISNDSLFLKLPLFIIAIWIFLRDRSVVLKLWIIIIFTALIFYPYHVPEYYLLLIFPIVLVYSVGFLNNNRAQKTILFLISVASIWQFFSKNPLKENKTSLHFKNQVVSHIANQANGGTVKIYYSNDLGLNKGFNYLFWWRRVNVVDDAAEQKFLIIIPASREPETPGEIFGEIKVAQFLK